jgi:hypothetical protein
LRSSIINYGEDQREITTHLGEEEKNRGRTRNPIKKRTEKLCRFREEVPQQNLSIHLLQESQSRTRKKGRERELEEAGAGLHPTIY